MGCWRREPKDTNSTWMDAKVDGWVVTPRRGKAVEINALWYNALKLMEGWVGETRGDAAARPYARHAEQARQSFNAAVLVRRRGLSLRRGRRRERRRPGVPPQPTLRHLAAAPGARPRAVGSRGRGRAKRLLNPRRPPLARPGHPDFRARYFGDLRARDAAYHQGTVWAWLIGPFIDAWLKVHPNDRAGARRFSKVSVPHLSEGSLGTISEIFDAEPPHTRAAALPRPGASPRCSAAG